MDKENDDMWVNGWLAGKYQPFQSFPSFEAEVWEWLNGFRMGCAEMAMYEKWEICFEACPEEYSFCWSR
jgi:hypothetical protein